MKAIQCLILASAIASLGACGSDLVVESTGGKLLITHITSDPGAVYPEHSGWICSPDASAGPVIYECIDVIAQQIANESVDESPETFQCLHGDIFHICQGRYKK